MKKTKAILLAKKLKSTRRKQCRGTLRRGGSGGMCALGFACEVYRSETGKGKWRGEAFITPGVTAHDSYGVPEVVKKWYGLEQSEIAFIVSMNDSYKFTFPEIAEEILDGVR